MYILKYPKPPKRLKYKDIVLNVRIKCDDCRTVFCINSVDDFTLDTGLLFWHNPKIPVFFTQCPYCNSKYIPLSYQQCKRIWKWARNTGVTIFHERGLMAWEEIGWRF